MKIRNLELCVLPWIVMTIMCSSLTNSFSQDYIIYTLGGTESTIGQILSLRALTTALLTPLCGKYAQYGLKRFIILALSSCLLVSSIVQFLTRQLTLYYFSSILMSTANCSLTLANLYTSSYQASVIPLKKDKERTTVKILGHNSSALNLGFLMGSLVGSHLYSYSISSYESPYFVFLFNILIGATSLIWAYWMILEPEVHLEIDTQGIETHAESQPLELIENPQQFTAISVDPVSVNQSPSKHSLSSHKENIHMPKESSKKIKSSFQVIYTNLLNNRYFFRAFIFHMILIMTMGIPQQCYILFILNRLKLIPRHQSYVFSSVLCLSIIIQLASSRLTTEKRYYGLRPITFYQFCLSLLAISCFLVPLGGIKTFIMALLFSTFGSSLSKYSLAQLIKSSPKDVVGTIYGINDSVASLSTIFSGLICPIIWKISQSFSFWIEGTIYLLMIANVSSIFPPSSVQNPTTKDQ